MKRGHVRTLTLTEVLAAGAAVGLLFTLTVPALHAGGGRNRSDVCLGNLEALGLAVRMYAEDQGTLPGRLHPAVSHFPPDPNDPFTNYGRNRILIWKLRAVLGEGITDRLATCPVAEGIKPDSNFAAFYSLTSRLVYPAHYVVNNWGSIGEQSGVSDNVRATRPQYYFGYSPPPGSGTDPVQLQAMVDYPVQPLGKILRAAEEWMIADAWYRPKSGAPELQQEGPYQTSWSGEALPNFAPHQRRDTGGYTYTSSLSRNSDSAAIRSRKSDGVTNTVFFDGHAAPVPSKSFVLYATDILYGFPGTVNPLMQSPPPTSVYLRAIWR